ncbi:MAG: MBL fold metallo-hydrolase [Candidatus Eremiobacteraeota bacterium]|nr:MBL fold metallo-hydrolase [Candidatus Eremiobacteraeota bacterium]
MIAIDDEMRIPSLGLWLDARRPRSVSFISHAHSDHIGNHHRAIATQATADLCRRRMPRASTTAYETYEYGEAFAIGEASVELLSAGHILGSSQILIRTQHQTFVYTGDFKLRAGRTQPACAVPRCDTLLMECTYGRPHYRFPERAAVEEQIVSRCRAALTRAQTPIIYAYALGKAQEIIAVLASADLPVMVHEDVATVCSAYELLGVSLGPWTVYSAAHRAGRVLVMPPFARRSSMVKQIFPRYEIAVTGWAMDAGTRYRLGVDLALPYSDHADFCELLEYVERAQPKRVFCVHGFPDFVLHLRRAGVDAQWLTPNPQLELFA